MTRTTMPEQTEHDTNVRSVRAKWAFGVFATIGAFFLVAEHRAHVLPYLPWLLLAACPLMHLFMHHGHGGRHDGHGDGGSDAHAHGDGSGSEGRGDASHHQTPRGQR